MNNSNNMNDSIQLLTSLYYEYYSYMLRIPVNVIISDCLSKSYIELRPDLEERLMQSGIEKIDNNNGLMVLPCAIKNNINIIISIDKIVAYTQDGSMTWCGTFAHELTHAIDSHQMAVKEKLDSYLLLETNEYYLFRVWSEYHARRMGYSFLRKMLDIDNESNNEKSRIEYIQKVEWPSHLNSHYTEYHETNDANIKLNITMQLLGRYSVWRDLFPQAFNEAALKETFSNTPWMYQLFTFLYKFNTLDAIYSNFEDMRLVLLQNWKGL